MTGRIDVANLWRLEAQADVFIVDDELLDTYPFEYLVFPTPRTPVSLWDREKVYPDERSDLELIVEQWFWHEQASAGTRWIKQEFFENGVALQELAAGPTDGIGLKGIIRPGPHPSWSRRETSWSRRTERFDLVRPRPSDMFEVSLRAGMDVDAVCSSVAESLPLSSVAERRTRAQRTGGLW